MHPHVSGYILFKTRTGDEKDDNNSISNVSAYTPSSETGRNSKMIRADLMYNASPPFNCFVPSHSVSTPPLFFLNHFIFLFEFQTPVTLCRGGVCHLVYQPQLERHLSLCQHLFVIFFVTYSASVCMYYDSPCCVLIIDD